MTARWARPALALLASLLGLGLAEGLVRLAAPQSLRPAWDDELSGIRVPRAGLSGRHVVPGRFDVTVSINRQRFRARREYAELPPADTTRVAVLGDSLAFGWGAEDDETYPARLEALLAESLAPGRVEVINAAFPGTCLGEKAAWYELGVRPFRPRVVILTALGDDVDGDLFWRVFSLDAAGRARPSSGSRRGPSGPAVRATRSLFQSLPGHAALAERSQLFGLLRRAATRLVSAERTTALGQRPATPQELERFKQQGLPLLQAELRWLVERTGEDGAHLALVFLPFRDSVYPTQGWWADELRWKSREVSEALRAVCEEQDVAFEDVTPQLATLAHSGGPALYFEGADTHPTPDGYRAIARSVAPLVVELLKTSEDDQLR